MVVVVVVVDGSRIGSFPDWIATHPEVFLQERKEVVSMAASSNLSENQFV